MTPQSVFDSIVAHLRAQGCKSLDADGNCMYRGLNGTKCAAGILIPDEAYFPWMEGKGFQPIVADYAYDHRTTADERIIVRNALRMYDRTEYSNIVYEMQTLHDKTEVESWEEGFASIANRYALTYTPIYIPKATS